jgi:hypothetical protein
MADLSMSPDLRELLGEIAEDPRAQLLRVKSAQAAREGLERNPKVSSSAPFLRKAERRLLELYREELGRLLYAYAHVARMQVPENESRVHYQDCKHPEPTKPETDHGARPLLEFRGADEAEADLLRRCLGSTHGIDPSEIIGAALRVAPSDKAQVMLGTDLSLKGSSSEARNVLTAFLAREPRSQVDSFAWEALGFLACQEGSYGQAAGHYEAAVRFDPGRVIPGLAWLRFSLLAGVEDAASRAAAFIDRMVPEESPAIEWYQALSRRSIGPKSSPEQKRLARLVADQSGPVSRRLIHGYP